jgi:hypothetical protein
MFRRTRLDAATDPLDGLSPRQIEALSERFGNGGRLTPLRLIGLRMGCSRASAFCLIRRGIRNLAMNGWELANPPAPFRSERAA